MNEDPNPFAPVNASARRAANVKPKFSIVVPVPHDAPPPPAEHFRLGEPIAIWTYTAATGSAIGYVLRFDSADGKQFRPLTLWRSEAGGKPEWRWESWPPKRPLFGLQRLAERPSAPVVVTEGEKAADAAAMLLACYVVVTSPN
jgi:putative DNA primase/helicase